MTRGGVKRSVRGTCLGVLLTGFRILGDCSEGPPVGILVFIGAALNVDLHWRVTAMVGSQDLFHMKQQTVKGLEGQDSEWQAHEGPSYVLTSSELLSSCARCGCSTLLELSLSLGSTPPAAAGSALQWQLLPQAALTKP